MSKKKQEHVVTKVEPKVKLPASPTTTNKWTALVERAVLDDMAIMSSVAQGKEAGGLLFGTLCIETETAHIKSVVFPKQKGTSGEVDFDNDDAGRIQYAPMERWMAEHESMDGFNDAVARGEVDVCLGWWHIHPSMSTSPSPTDWEYSYSLSQPGLMKGGWAIMWITKREVRDHAASWIRLVSYVGARFVTFEFGIEECMPEKDEVREAAEAAWSPGQNSYQVPRSDTDTLPGMQEFSGVGGLAPSFSIFEEVASLLDSAWGPPATDKVKGRVCTHWTLGEGLKAMSATVRGAAFNDLAKVCYTSQYNVGRVWHELEEFYDEPKGWTDDHTMWTMKAIQGFTRDDVRRLVEEYGTSTKPSGLRSI